MSYDYNQNTPLKYASAMLHWTASVHTTQPHPSNSHSGSTCELHLQLLDLTSFLFTTSHTKNKSVESQIAGMAFFSTGSASFLCTPRPGMLGNQCTALIKALTSCLYRKQSLVRSLLIPCRSRAVCDIVLPIKACLSMKTSTGMWSYLYVICCLRVRLNRVVLRVQSEALKNRHRTFTIQSCSCKICLNECKL